MSLTAEAYDCETAKRHLTARLQASMEEHRLRKLREDELQRRASVLLDAGTTLIPCEYLMDNEFIVSRNVYEAAKRIA
jgi:hypothetical protein